MKIIKNYSCIFITVVIVLFFYLPVKSQVTIGSQKASQNFSILELISTEGGLRLPQLTSGERDSLKLDALTDSVTIEAAKGLVVYNTDVDCLEFWSGDKWISLCQPAMGNGTETNPYIICSPESLDAIRDKPDAHYKLCGDIDLTDYLATGAGQTKWGSNGWLPIGDATTPFTGSLDGDGHTISGLWIQHPEAGFGSVGLFGIIYSGSVKNLTVEIDAAKGINGGINTHVGGIAGRIRGDGSAISNCCVKGGDLRGGNSVGGIAGRVDHGNSSVTCCYTSINVSGSNGIGGVVGQISSDVTAERGGSLTNSYATGNVTGTTGVGGVAGRVQNSGNLAYCYATGAISRNAPNTNANYIGGVSGRVDSNGKINSCVALNSSVSSTVVSTAYVGRVVGNADGSLSNNWALSNMTITDGNGSPKVTINNAGNVDGADMNDTNSKTANWWTTVPGWDNNIWNFVNNQLPTLK